MNTIIEKKSPEPPFPGGYAVSLKGVLPGGVCFTRLCMYSFQPGGTMRSDFWFWREDAPVWSAANPGDYGSIDRQVGYANQASYPYNFDQNAFVQGSRKFSDANATPTTIFGTWVMQGSDSVLVDFNGSTELWKTTWSDATLNKIELQQANYVEGAFYLKSTGGYDITAVNAGWGFGGKNVGFTSVANINGMHKDLPYGRFIRHNSWNGADEPVALDSMSLASVFLSTTTGVLRYVTWDSTPGAQHHGFSYLAQPMGNSGLTSGRVCYQVSHDFNNNGHIADDVGHTYSGLQVIDQVGNFRGFVFSDSSVNGAPLVVGRNHTISALYYLDTPTT